MSDSSSRLLISAYALVATLILMWTAEYIHWSFGGL